MMMKRTICRLRCEKSTKIRARFVEAEPEGRPFRVTFYGEGASEFVAGELYDIDFRVAVQQ